MPCLKEHLLITDKSIALQLHGSSEPSHGWRALPAPSCLPIELVLLRERKRARERERERKQERVRKRKTEWERERERQRASWMPNDMVAVGSTTGWICLNRLARSANVHNSICLLYAEFNGLSCMVPGLSLLGGALSLYSVSRTSLTKNSCNTKVVFNHFDRGSYQLAVAQFPLPLKHFSAKRVNSCKTSRNLMNSRKKKHVPARAIQGQGGPLTCESRALRHPRRGFDSKWSMSNFWPDWWTLCQEIGHKTGAKIRCQTGTENIKPAQTRMPKFQRILYRCLTVSSWHIYTTYAMHGLMSWVSTHGQAKRWFKKNNPVLR